MACGQRPGGPGGVSSWSQVTGCFPDDLHGTGAQGSWAPVQARERVDSGSLPGRPGCVPCGQEDGEAVHPGLQRVGPQEGGDEAQEQEGVGGLHVLSGALRQWSASCRSAVLKASVSRGVLGVGKSLLPQPHQAGDDGHQIQLEGQQCKAEQHLATRHGTTGAGTLAAAALGKARGRRGRSLLGLRAPSLFACVMVHSPVRLCMGTDLCISNTLLPPPPQFLN